MGHQNSLVSTSSLCKCESDIKSPPNEEGYQKSKGIQGSADRPCQ